MCIHILYQYITLDYAVDHLVFRLYLTISAIQDVLSTWNYVSSITVCWMLFDFDNPSYLELGPIIDAFTFQYSKSLWPEV